MSDMCGTPVGGGRVCIAPSEYEVMPVSVTVDPDDHSTVCREHVAQALTSRDSRAEQWSVYQLTPQP